MPWSMAQPGHHHHWSRYLHWVSITAWGGAKHPLTICGGQAACCPICPSKFLIFTLSPVLLPLETLVCKNPSCREGTTSNWHVTEDCCPKLWKMPDLYIEVLEKPGGVPALGNSPFLLGDHGCPRDLDNLGPACMAENVDIGKVKPLCIDMYKQGGALPVTGAATALAEGTTGVRPAGKAETASTTRPEALVPWVKDKVVCGHEGCHWRASANMAQCHNTAQMRTITSPVGHRKSHPVHLGGTRPLRSWRKPDWRWYCQVKRACWGHGHCTRHQHPTIKSCTRLCHPQEKPWLCRSQVGLPAPSWGANHTPGPIHHHPIPPLRSPSTFHLKAHWEGHGVILGDAEQRHHNKDKAMWLFGGHHTCVICHHMCPHRFEVSQDKIVLPLVSSNL